MLGSVLSFEKSHAQGYKSQTLGQSRVTLSREERGCGVDLRRFFFLRYPLTISMALFIERSSQDLTNFCSKREQLDFSVFWENCAGALQLQAADYDKVNSLVVGIRVTHPERGNVNPEENFLIHTLLCPKQNPHLVWSTKAAHVPSEPRRPSIFRNKCFFLLINFYIVLSQLNG